MSRWYAVPSMSDLPVSAGDLAAFGSTAIDDIRLDSEQPPAAGSMIGFDISSQTG